MKMEDQDIQRVQLARSNAASGGRLRCHEITGRARSQIDRDCMGGVRGRPGGAAEFCSGFHCVWAVEAVSATPT